MKKYNLIVLSIFIFFTTMIVSYRVGKEKGKRITYETYSENYTDDGTLTKMVNTSYGITVHLMKILLIHKNHWDEVHGGIPDTVRNLSKPHVEYIDSSLVVIEELRK